VSQFVETGLVIVIVILIVTSRHLGRVFHLARIRPGTRTVGVSASITLQRLLCSAVWAYLFLLRALALKSYQFLRARKSSRTKILTVSISPSSQELSH
jgi:hypothetical protein